MLFLNLILAGGLAAVSAPILIHLLHRARIVPRDWAAMMFLEELVAARSRSLKIRDWLLLAIRAGMIASLVFAMMQPVFTTASLGARAPDAPTSAIILLDDSASMAAGQARTVWQDAQELAIRHIDTLRSGDDVTVLRVSDAARGFKAPALYDFNRAREIIREAVPQQTAADVPQALSGALLLAAARHGIRQEIVLFTDMQSSNWFPQEAGRWTPVLNAIQSARIRPAMFVAALPDLKPENVAVLDVTASRAVIDPKTPVRFQFTLSNEGLNARDVTVSFLADSVVKATRSVTLSANSRETVSFEHAFDSAGSHSVGCRIRASGDALAFDNELFHSVLVMERLPVLLVDGDRRTQVLSSETGFLRLALSPDDRDDPNWKPVVEAVAIDAADLRYTDLNRFRVVVLANVAALPAATVSELERFVVAGGGLLIALGDKVRPETYNRDLFRAGAGLLPLALERLEGDQAVVANAPTNPVRLGGLITQTPALDLFRPERGQDWSRARIRNYFASAAPGEGVRVLAAYDNGQAAFAQKQLGEGKIILFTSSLDNEWSDLPVHPFYVALMQSLVFDLASAVIPPRNLEVGQTLYHVAQNELAGRPHALQTPDGTSKPLAVQRQGSLAVFSSEDTAQPGLYTVIPEGARPEDRVYYTVTAPRSESNLERLALADQKRIATEGGFSIAANWQELAEFLNLQTGGVSLSSVFIVIAVALCLVEVFLLRRWS